MVVSASKTEEKLVNAPATMTVVGLRQIETATSQNFAELLRTVPGLNITQVSARDINITTRGATGTLATGQLALLDGRSLYQDFFGFVMWDFLPVNLNEIKQVEVIRGPGVRRVGRQRALRRRQRHHASRRARCRARAPRSGFGTLREDQRRGQRIALVRERHALAGDQRSVGVQAVGRRLFAGSALAPDRHHSGDQPAVCDGWRHAYPAYTNTGTTQPKFDGRVDYDYEDGAQAVVLRRRRRHRRHHALRHRPVRHQQRVGHELREGELHEGRLRAGLLHEHAQR